MTADGPLDQPVMGQAIETTLLAIARGSCEQQAEVARRAGLEEPLFQGDEDGVGRADTNEAGGGDHVVRADDRHGFQSTHDLVAHRLCSGPAQRSRWASQSTMPLPTMPCDLPDTKTPIWPPGRPSSV